jgi:hypothetical protein
MSLYVRKERDHCNEKKDKSFDIDVNVLDQARNGIELISFHPFPGQRNLAIYSVSHLPISSTVTTMI